LIVSHHFSSGIVSDATLSCLSEKQALRCRRPLRGSPGGEDGWFE
jgi:hypothetical protein